VERHSTRAICTRVSKAWEGRVRDVEAGADVETRCNEVCRKVEHSGFLDVCCGEEEDVAYCSDKR